MTNKERYLEAFFKKNPQFKEKDVVKMMSRSMEKIISQSYDKGYNEGFAKGKLGSTFKDSGGQGSKEGEDLFNSLFGNGNIRK